MLSYCLVTAVLYQVSVFGSVLTDVPPLRQGVMHVFKKLTIVVGFTLTIVNDFRRFLSQFSTIFHKKNYSCRDYPESIAKF